MFHQIKVSLLTLINFHYINLIFQFSLVIKKAIYKLKAKAAFVYKVCKLVLIFKLSYPKNEKKVIDRKYTLKNLLTLTSHD